MLPLIENTFGSEDMTIRPDKVTRVWSSPHALVNNRTGVPDFTHINLLSVKYNNIIK